MPSQNSKKQQPKDYYWLVKSKRVRWLGTVTLLIVLIWLALAGYQVSWTGFGDFKMPDSSFVRAKTFWDWMELLIIPLILAGGAFYLNRSEREREREREEKRAVFDREISTDQHREATLQAYLDRIADLLVKEKLATSESSQEVRHMAAIRTLTLLRELDITRKGLVLRFLIEAGLAKQKYFFELIAAELQGASLQGAHLEHALLQGANLQGANLSEAILRNIDMESANLQGVNLQGAHMERANLRGALLQDAELQGTYLGGSQDDDASGVMLDSTNNVYVIGKSFSTDFPTTFDAYDRINTETNKSDVFIVKVGALGAPPAQTSTHLDIPSLASSDDAEEQANGSMLLTSPGLELVTDKYGVLQGVGLRFTNVNIPPGAIIQNAEIQFTASAGQSGATSLTIQAEASDNPGTFTSASNDISSRPRTSASVAWNSISAWIVDHGGPDQRTPDFASVVQEVVDRPGWASGNALAIIITGSGRRDTASFETEGSKYSLPYLHIEYILTTPTATPTPTATSTPTPTATSG